MSAIRAGRNRSHRVTTLCVLIAFVLGCGGSKASKAKQACDRLDSMCGDLIDNCEDALANADAKVVSCVLDAKSCPEILGCVMGEVQRELDPVFDQWEHDFDRGFGKTKHSR